MRTVSLALFLLLPGCFFLGECVPPDDAVVLTVVDGDGAAVAVDSATSSFEGGVAGDCIVEGNEVRCGAGSDGPGQYDIVVTAAGFEQADASFDVASSASCTIEQQVDEVVLAPSP